MRVLKGKTKSTRVAYAKAMVLCAQQHPRMFLSVLNYGDKKDMQERLTFIKKDKQRPLWRWLAVATSVVVMGLTFNFATAGIDKGQDHVQPLTRVEPIYPKEAAKQGIEGSVVLSYDIDSQGNVQNVSVIDANPRKTFDKAAKIALRQWTYEKPAKPIKGVKVQLDFLLGPEPMKTAKLDGKQEQILVIE